MATSTTTIVYKGSKDKTIVKAEREKTTDLKPNEISIKITHSGVCGTDEHYKGVEMVLGHEGVGTVDAVGDNVTNFKVGDRAGFGFVHGGCGKCAYCIQGLHWHCSTPGGARFFGAADHDQGSFSTQAVWPQTLIRHIPESMASEDAAPLMCAGQTVFTPLLRYRVKGTDRVGVVGIGGLGHLAIQFAAKWGCEVVIFSSSENKREEATSLGASEFYATKGVKELKVRKPINHVIVTTSVLPDWQQFIPNMAPFGKIIIATIGMEDIVVPLFPFLGKELSIVGSCSATPKEVDQMLEFAAFHKVKPVLQTFPMTQEGITEAMERLETGKVRYRAVLKV